MAGRNAWKVAFLSPSIRTRLRSGIAITSPVHCVEELLHNAIDAEADEVNVVVDLPCFRISVHDNGHGITKEDLGKIGDRYMTSKCRSLSQLQSGLESMGYRGEALASMIDISERVQIVSKVDTDPGTWVVLFVKGRRMNVEKYYKDFKSSGTSVVITNLMFNLPVRQQRLSPTLDLEEIRYSMTALALANQGLVLTLLDSVSGKKVLTLPKCSSTSMAFRALFGAYWTLPRIREVRHEKRNYLLTGLIGLEAVASRRKQFVFVNRRHVRKTLIHKTVRECLQRSIMCRQAQPKVEPITSSQESPTRCQPVHPVFCLNITCPRMDYDFCLEPRKTDVHFDDWDFVLRFVKEGVYEFLGQHNLLLPNLSVEDLLETKEDETSTGGIFVETDLNISGITPIQEDHSPGRADCEREEATCGKSSDSDSGIVTGTSGSLESTDFESRYMGPVADDMRQSKPVMRPSSGPRMSVTTLAKSSGSFSVPKPESGPSILAKKDSSPHERQLPSGWVKKVTKTSQTFYVHLSSGVVVDDVAKCEKPELRGTNDANRVTRKRPHGGTKLLLSGKSMFSAKRQKSALHHGAKDAEMVTTVLRGEELCNREDLADKWLPGERQRLPATSKESSSLMNLLENWKNPNFKFESPVADIGDGKKIFLSQEAFRFERQMFTRMRIVGQVDHKFIACVVNQSQSQSRYLTLFDQHAVHERIRLETLISEALPASTNAASVTVDPPLCLRPPDDDFDVLSKFLNRVEKYGLFMEVHKSKQFVVRRVPHCFVKRELSELKNNRPSPLRDLVQSYLQDVAEAMRETRGGSGAVPSTMRNVLASQACRSAIKFGDPLTLSQCLSLLDRLRTCQAPFQCAHGRPALAPVLNLTRFRNLTKASPNPRYQFSMAKLKALVSDADE